MGMLDFLNIKMDFFKKKDAGSPGSSGDDIDLKSMGLSQPTFGPPPRDLPPEMAMPSATQSYPPLSMQPSSKPIGSAEFVTQENMKAKIDLIMTHIENLKLQHDTINQRLDHIEGMVKQLLDIAKGRY